MQKWRKPKGYDDLASWSGRGVGDSRVGGPWGICQGILEQLTQVNASSGALTSRIAGYCHGGIYKKRVLLRDKFFFVFSPYEPFTKPANALLIAVF